MRIFVSWPHKTDSVGLPLFFFMFFIIALIIGFLGSALFWPFRIFFAAGGVLFFLVGVIGIKSLKRLDASLRKFPSKWRKFLRKNSLYYPYLAWKGRRRFERDIKILLSELNIRRIDGNTIGWEPRLLIVTGLATFLMGKPNWELPLINNIFVIPGGQLNEKLKPGNGKYAAAATRKALYLTEESLALSFNYSGDGYNNIFHEVAHYFDMEGYKLNGSPSYDRLEDTTKGELAYVEWKRVLDREFVRAQQGEFQLRPYALKSKSEFFACANEYFFEQPEKLRKDSPDIYSMLTLFFNFDPAELLQQRPRLP
jgi:Mlc titration factor MtfA (ptsG expression regulator)